MLGSSDSCSTSSFREGDQNMWKVEICSAVLYWLFRATGKVSSSLCITGFSPHHSFPSTSPAHVKGSCSQKQELSKAVDSKKQISCCTQKSCKCVSSGKISTSLRFKTSTVETHEGTLLNLCISLFLAFFSLSLYFSTTCRQY